MQPRVLLPCLLLAATAEPGLAQSFTVIGLPDTQAYSEFFPEIYIDQVEWIADNLDTLDVAFVSHYGDLVQHGNQAGEWAVADQAQAVLDALSCANSVTPGNHDLTPSGTPGSPYLPEFFQYYFPTSRYSAESWWGGASETGMSSFQVWSKDGLTFLSMSVELDTPLHELAWAQGVLDRNRDKPVLFTTHRYLQDGEDLLGVSPVPSGRYPAFWYDTEGIYTPGGIQSEQLWNWFLRRHSNVFLVNCGHFHEEFHQTSTNVYGAPVHEVLADYQALPLGGSGWLRIFTFDVGASRISASTYSPWLDLYDTSADSEFTLATDFSDYITSLSSLVLQEGINGYSGTLDTWVDQAEPDTAFGSGEDHDSSGGLEVAGAQSQEAQTLLRFEDLFESGAIPPGSRIDSAVLSLELIDGDDSSALDSTYSVHRVLVPWNEFSTWNSLAGGLQIGTDLTDSLAGFAGDNDPADDFLRRVDVTAAVQAWSDGQPNWGFAILPESGDAGLSVRSSESDIEILRPRLEIVFDEPCGYEAYGVGASPVNDLRLAGRGTPQVGTDLVAITLGAPSGYVTTALCSKPADLDLLGGKVLVDAALLLATATKPNIAGVSRWIVPIPNLPEVVGLEVYLQSFALDPSQPEGIALSNGLLARFCP